MAATSFIFLHRGMVKRDSLELRAFIALNISMTTRTLRDTVEADLLMWLLNMSHPISENSREQRWNDDSWEKVICGPAW